MKFWVVPESSDRLTGVIARSGSVAPGLSALMAGSFHFLIFWLKICAIVAGLRLSFSMPSRLKAMAIGLM